MTIPASERMEIARACGLSEQFLYQCLTGRRSMDPADAVRAERASSGRVRRWHVRSKDSHEIWPELVGLPEAPEVPGLQA